MIDFLGLGAMKAGSNWQRKWLGTHPDIFIAPEELHFWEGRRGWTIEEYAAQFAGARDGQLRGEITPFYAILDDRQIAAVHSHAPELRLFYCLRNPIDRAWAHIRMGHDQGRLDLTRMPDAEILALFDRENWRRAGAYRENIEAWTSHFGEDRLHIFFFEDVIADPVATLAALARHLGVDPGHFTGLPEHRKRELHAPVFTAASVPIPASILAYLRDEYAEAIESLGVFLSRDLSHWIENPDCATPSDG